MFRFRNTKDSECSYSVSQNDDCYHMIVDSLINYLPLVYDHQSKPWIFVIIAVVAAAILSAAVWYDLNPWA